MSLRTRVFRRDAIRFTEYWLDVPADHNAPTSDQITLFCREYASTSDYEPGAKPKPYLLFLQGGPGASGYRIAPVNGWMKEALKDFRVLQLDQRGTGLSTRLDAQTLTARGTPNQQAEFAALFRADQIVADAEALRKEINSDQPWFTLGQSYGGFITLAYLTHAPQGLAGCFITGGLPALDTPLDDVYRRTFALTAAANEFYFTAYPGDETTLRILCRHLGDTEEYLPTGERLTALRLRGLGLMLGMRTSFDTLHFLLEDPFIQVKGTRRLNGSFLQAVGSQLSHGSNPLFALLHEPIYAGATPAISGQATNWSAHRLRSEITGFSAHADPACLTEPYYLHAEHIYRELFASDPALTPLAQVSDILALRTDWPVLYDPAILANNEVPVTAAAYLDDMYVPWHYSEHTAKTIRGLRLWVTNEHLHDGLRASGSAVLQHLINLSRE